MSDLLLLPEPDLPALLEADLDAARDYAEAEKSAATREAYGSDWRIFTAWCLARGATPLPATPQTVAAFLASEDMRRTAGGRARLTQNVDQKMSYESRKRASGPCGRNDFGPIVPFGGRLPAFPERAPRILPPVRAAPYAFVHR